MNRTTSLYLDVVRPIAALVVLLSHVSFISGGHLGFLASAGSQAVDVFFVLSGFVIAYVCDTKEQDPWVYFVSRAARIYSVAIPAIVLTLLADRIGLRADTSAYVQAFQTPSPGSLVRSILFLGEQWNAHRFPGSDSPYWSLGFEVWYYIIFGVFRFNSPQWRWLLVGGALLFIGPKVVLVFPVWLMGVAAYHVCAGRRLPPLSAWILATAPLVLLAIYETLPYPQPYVQPFQNVALEPNRFLSLGQEYLIAGLFSIHLIGFASVSGAFASMLERHARLIRWISGATFSIYLAHLPIMHLLVAISPAPRSSVLTLALMLALTPLACLLFAELSERRKEVWRRAMMSGAQALKMQFVT